MKHLFSIILLMHTFSMHSQSISNNDLDSVLCRVYDIDQDIRKDFNKKFNDPDFDVKAYNAKMDSIDKDNQQIVFKILDSSGWPKGLSEKANRAIFIVIDHSGKELATKYFPFVQKKAEEGVIEKHLSATLNDRILMKNGKKQIYGTQSLTLGDGDSKKIYIWPVENEKKIDKLREKVGLESIDKYINRLSKAFQVECVWNKNLKIEDIPEYHYNY